MQEIMTVDSMKDYMRAAGQYAARIADLTQEIQELAGTCRERVAVLVCQRWSRQSRWQRRTRLRPPT